MQQRYPLKPICFLVLQALACYAHAAAPEGEGEAAAATSAVQVVEVTGQGQSRQVQNITRADLQKAIPGTSPLLTLEKLPGVSFQSADPFGAYEWSTRFSIRGFNQNQLGFTLDGVPLGDMSYGNNNGLHISRAISSENIGRVAVSQGAGALSTASTSNLGGTVQFYTLDPSDTMGVTASQTLGSASTSRTFVRVDSGLLSTGTKFYLSGTRMRADKWKGDGPQDQDQFNSKIVHIFGDNKLSAFYNYSTRSEVDYQDLSLDMVKRLGYNWDNYAPDWQRAVNASKGIYTGGVNSMDDAYYLGRGLRKDNLGGLSLDLQLTPAAVLKTTIYHHDNKGQGHWYTPYTPSSATVPISIRTTEYSIGRDGVTSDLTWDLANHTINAGFWGERSLHTLTRNFYAVTDGTYQDHFLSNPTSTGFQQDFTTTTRQFYLQDTVSLLNDKLSINFGFKTPKVAIDAVSLVGTRAAGDIVAKKTFLPQAGITYRLNQNDEIFTSFSNNMRAYQPGVNGPFSQTQQAFDLNVSQLKPETSTTIDLGMRFKRDAVQGSIAVYYADFKDRQLGIATCAGIVGCPSTIANVGKVETSGLEALAVWKLSREVSWFNSFTYNSSKYKSNYIDNGNVVAVAGKDVVDAPRIMFNTELTYENAAWFTRLGGKFTDKRYYTYTNDASVPSFWTSTLSAGYKFKNVGAFKDVSVQLNVSNLFDKQYFSTIGTNGFAASDPNGTLATLLAGAPRQVFLTVSGKL
ncbi:MULTISPECIES: TonB-dependent receptor [unclassified Janthinobacterium]|uniref:TonB-dependent receptor n=1 Tax=unclassified Janthinobacterium TaxID=2610881 RepID=UPI00161A5022|nr:MULTISPECIES: TonB-dependent receptor [unclassified Janthinobacterium]MBB5367858.1 iron complex outermembrane receptor protein [Janthinobacterium sp. K2C7]MBB5379664.1 iron complex outermembrane receptor protein [Janthinobacterium sp. K2Li3]MBB5386240.1 iron complex outermembrane receptor protein [Janthinobacterium sp. K2E3]